MSTARFTRKQVAFLWLIQELLTDYSQTGSFSLTQEFLDSLCEIDRKRLLEALFWRALEFRDWRLTEHCVDAGFPIKTDPKDLSDSGPLHSMIINSSTPSRAAIDWLLGQGAEIERHGWQGCTPLFAAAVRDLGEIVTTLLQHGANVDASTEFDEGFLVDGGYTSLMVAAEQGAKASVIVLLDYGANRFLRNENGETAVDLARSAGHQEIVNLLENPWKKRRK